jgi:plastocyanin
MRRTMIAIAVVLAAWAVGGQAIAGDEAAKRAKKVTADNFDFEPQRVKVSPGTKVVWTSTQGSHTVTFKGGFDKTIPQGASTSRKFKKAGTFKYICRFHTAQGMKGKVVVG